MRLRSGAQPAAVRAAVERVIGEPDFRATAQRVGARMVADAAGHRGIIELEGLASGERSSP